MHLAPILLISFLFISCVSIVKCIPTEHQDENNYLVKQPNGVGNMLSMKITKQSIDVEELLVVGNKRQTFQEQLDDSFNKWTAVISVGTPAQSIVTIMDSGSTDLFVEGYCNPCSSGTNDFNSTKSSSFQTVPCSNSVCTNSQFCNYTCSSNSVCELAVQYGIGSALGDVATEKVQIGPYSGTVQFVRVLTQQTSVFSQTIGGILGLGAVDACLNNGQSPIFNLLGDAPHTFTFCQLFSNNGTIYFGEDYSNSTIPYTWIPYHTVASYYSVNMTNILVGLDSISQPDISQMITIFDSGSTQLILAPSIFNNITSQLVGICETNYSTSQCQSYFTGTTNGKLTCLSLPSQLLDGLPNITLLFDSVSIILSARMYFNPCLASNNYSFGLDVYSDTPVINIIGSTVHAQYRVAYDIGDSRIGIAPHDYCPNLSNPIVSPNSSSTPSINPPSTKTSSGARTALISLLILFLCIIGFLLY